jgi:sugar phosphate permease
MLHESLLSDGAAANDAKMESWKRTIFLITFVNYAMSHVARKCYTNVKTDLVNEGVDKIILSQMDMAFMFTYAIGSFISGRLGDTLPQK